MTARLTWRDLRQNWKRSILAVLLFAAPVFLIGTFLGLVEGPWQPPAYQGKEFVASVSTWQCKNTSDDGFCTKDPEALNRPDLQRIATTVPGEFVPELNLTATIHGSDAEFYQVVTASEVDTSSIAVPPPGQIYLSQRESALLGVQEGDQVSVSFGGVDSTHTFTVETPEEGHFYGGRSSVNIADLSFFDPATAASAQIPADWHVQWYSDSTREVFDTDQGVSVYSAIPAPPPAKEDKKDLLVVSFLKDLNADDLAGTIALTVLIAVLLASIVGPIFAVAAGRNLRINGMLAANGATSAQLRGIMLWHGVFIGLAGAIVGTALTALAGIGIRVFSADIGFAFHLDLWVALIVLVMLWGLIAAVVPAIRASRMDPVQALAGGASVRMRRLRPWHLIPLAFGALFFLLIIFDDGDALPVYIAGLITVVVLSAPLLLLGASRIVRFVSLPARLAIRDGVRNYGRTMPAIGAIAGCLLIGLFSAGFATPLIPGAHPVVTAKPTAVSASDPVVFQEPLHNAQHVTHAPLRVDRYEQFGADDYIVTPTDGATPYSMSPLAEALYIPSSFEYGSGVFIATPNIIDFLVLRAPETVPPEKATEYRDALENGIAIAGSRNLLTDGTITLTKNQTSVQFPAISLPFDSESPSVIITPDMARDVGIQASYNGSIFADGKPLNIFQQIRLNFGNNPLQITNEGDDGLGSFFLIPLGLAIVLTFIVTLLLVLLTGMETRKDQRIMASLGGSPALLRRYCGAQGMLVSALGLLGAVIGAALLFLAFLWRNTEIAIADVYQTLLYSISAPLLIVCGAILLIGWLTGLIFGSRFSGDLATR